jgi:hypothetical protein
MNPREVFTRLYKREHNDQPPPEHLLRALDELVQLDDDLEENP